MGDEGEGVRAKVILGVMSPSLRCVRVRERKLHELEKGLGLEGLENIDDFSGGRLSVSGTL